MRQTYTNLSLHRSQGIGGGGLLCLLKTGRGLTPISIKEGQGIGRADQRALLCLKTWE